MHVLNQTKLPSTKWKTQLRQVHWSFNLGNTQALPLGASLSVQVKLQGFHFFSKSNSQKYGEPIIEFYPNTAVPEGIPLIKQPDYISSTALNGQHDPQTLRINHNHNQTQNRLSIYLYSPLKGPFPAFTKEVGSNLALTLFPHCLNTDSCKPSVQYKSF